MLSPTSFNQPTVTNKKLSAFWKTLILALMLIGLIIWAASCQSSPPQLAPSNQSDQTDITNSLVETPTPPPPTSDNTGTLSSCQSNGYTANRIQNIIQLDEPSTIKFFTAKLVDGDQVLKDIQGLTCLEKLTIFNDGTNNISNLAPLAKLTNLRALEIDGASVTDLSPLNQLTQLTTLMIADSPIADLNGIKNLTNLAYLNLSGTDISDLLALKPLRKLKTLVLVNTNWSKQVLVNTSPLTDPDWESKLIYPAEIKALLTANPDLKIIWTQSQIK